MKIFYENSSILAENVKNALEDNNAKYALSILEDSQNYAALKTGASELVPVISKYICWNYESENIELFNGCVELLEKVVENSLSEELLVQLLEVIESAVDTTQFTTILPFVFKVLQKVSRDRSNFLSWTVNSLQVRLNKCRIPDYNEDSEQSESDVFKIEILYQDILRFYETIIPYFSERFQEQDVFRLILVKYLIQLLAKPIGYLDLGPHNEKSKIRKIAENIVRKILSLCKDPFEYFGMDDKDFVNPTIFAYGMFLHFLFDENVNYEMVPRIYDKTYVFHSSLIYIAKLLKSVSDLVVLKGLCTLEMLLKRTPRLSYRVLDVEANKTLCEVMEKIIVYNNDREIRQRALEVYKLYIHKFEAKGQYLLLTNLMYKTEHSGLAGFLITQFKDILFVLHRDNHPDLVHFAGEKMYKFIKKCYGTINTDGNLQYDKVLSLLNLMRYAAVQESVATRNLLETNASMWKKQFFERLEKSLERLREDYKKIIFNVENNKPHVDVDFDEYGDAVEPLTKEEKLLALNISLNQIEMTNSILKRTIELVDEGKSKADF